ncbi:hypothetical protein [Sphingomonas sp. BK345]|uniref:hypothetical protein n=1 Tax=Sphingomonas sp. BK345 TaxID=2586980 RepID=UPI00161D332F|nr:hypothetical protein [Sphingomonas sp. BK345]MBB3473570.1 hypothetical protein [Sphingomonas sp. BK345]
MPSDTLGERARLAVELALTARYADRPLRERQEADARRLGMVGAEIDAARLGRGFDVRTSRALALATAPDCDRQERRDGAIRAGLAESDCAAIEALAASLATGVRGRAG